ncbi:unnamed protein product, partial [Discosporangium mesarthrocarpum]
AEASAAAAALAPQVAGVAGARGWGEKEGTGRCLVVLDDVWEVDVVRIVVMAGFDVLVTTRNRSLVPDCPLQTVVNIGELTREEGRALLHKCSGLERGLGKGLERVGDPLPPSANAVLAACGSLAFSVALAGSLPAVSGHKGADHEAWENLATILVTKARRLASAGWSLMETSGSLPPGPQVPPHSGQVPAHGGPEAAVGEVHHHHHQLHHLHGSSSPSSPSSPTSSSSSWVVASSGLPGKSVPDPNPVPNPNTTSSASIASNGSTTSTSLGTRNSNSNSKGNSKRGLQQLGKHDFLDRGGGPDALPVETEAEAKGATSTWTWTSAVGEVNSLSPSILAVLWASMHTLTKSQAKLYLLLAVLPSGHPIRVAHLATLWSGVEGKGTKKKTQGMDGQGTGDQGMDDAQSVVNLLSSRKLLHRRMGDYHEDNFLSPNGGGDGTGDGTVCLCRDGNKGSGQGGEGEGDGKVLPCGLGDWYALHPLQAEFVKMEARNRSSRQFLNTNPNPIPAEALATGLNGSQNGSLASSREGDGAGTGAGAGASEEVVTLDLYTEGSQKMGRRQPTVEGTVTTSKGDVDAMDNMVGMVGLDVKFAPLPRVEVSTKGLGLEETKENASPSPSERFSQNSPAPGALGVSTHSTHSTHSTKDNDTTPSPDFSKPVGPLAPLPQRIVIGNVLPSQHTILARADELQKVGAGAGTYAWARGAQGSGVSGVCSDVG